SPGYWNRPELDAVAFPPDPNDPDARCYVSGDLGRIDDDGNLHFIGRLGSRVKIRGHSVDLMEVEAAMAACPGIQKAAVLASATAEGLDADRLVAYVVVGPPGRPDPAAIRNRLATLVPPYMLPSAFQFLKALPLTATGKIDRMALAALEPAKTAVDARVEPPQDELEMAIAGIFQRVLKRATVDRHDDFFVLGADSLLFADLQNRLLETFGVEVENFHRNATVAAAASAIRRQRAAASGVARPSPVIVPLQEGGSTPPLFLVHGRLPQVLVSPHFLGLLGSDQPVWAFQARGVDGLHAPHSSIEEMAEDYVQEMRKVCPRGPYFLGALCIGGFIAMEMARALRVAGESVLPLLLLDPPSIAFAMPDSALTEDGILRRLRRIQQDGVIVASIDDSAYLKASVRTAQAFEEAITHYRPRAYDGPVFMLSSRARIVTSNQDDLLRVFTGRVERYEVSAGHREALDAQGPQFAAALAQCLGRIREAAAAI
ncbi:MAG: alpha/beta fold hydrolase, partial [Aromatoleum sp.]|nr:alpha/beta fold hydrolase [Aromatoleum sp.]